jgi:hypothetical protein
MPFFLGHRCVTCQKAAHVFPLHRFYTTLITCELMKWVAVVSRACRCHSFLQ